MQYRVGMAIKIIVVLLVGLAFASVRVAEAQQAAKVHRIGFLLASSPGRDPRIEGFRQGLRELAYVEGRNIAIEWRYAEGKEEWFPSSRLSWSN
jgi:putative tryptophan/tyrosine transport system substrate-binding protein